MNPETQKMITALGLAPLPQEGGFFRQTWVSPEHLSNGRPAGSAILFLLTRKDFSALHRLRAEELWYFHAGDVVEHVQLDPRHPSARVAQLGPNALAGHTPQIVVPGNVWQGARLAPAANGAKGNSGWALLSCSLSPGWDERDFELGDRRALLDAFPDHAALVTALTRAGSE